MYLARASNEFSQQFAQQTNAATDSSRLSAEPRMWPSDSVCPISHARHLLSGDGGGGRLLSLLADPFAVPLVGV